MVALPYIPSEPDDRSEFGFADPLIALFCGKGEPSGCPFPEYADDPIGFAYDVLGINVLTEEQKQIMLSVRDNRITNVQAANSVGKTRVSAKIALWHVFAVGGLCVTTAPTEGQVKELLWSEIRKLYGQNKTKLGGNCGILSLRYSEYARAYGFVARDYDSNAFQGKHAERLLLILDEACGISKEIDEAAESCCTGSSNRMLRIGNPIAKGNPFSKACAHSSIKIPAWNHPNVAWAYEQDEDGVHRLKPEVAVKIVDSDRPITDPVRPYSEWPEDLPREVIPGAISIQWIEGARAKGEGSDFWQSRVNAKFPNSLQKRLLTESDWRKARRRYDENPAYWDRIAAKHCWRIGLDPADGGDDLGFAALRGCVIYHLNAIPTAGDREDTSRAADFAYDWALAKQHPTVIAVDRIGVGAGTLSQLIRRIRDNDQRHLLMARGYPNTEQKVHPDYADRFSEVAWKFRESFINGGFVVAPLPAHIEERIIEEFEATGYQELPSAKIKVDDKKTVKKRLEDRSPDLRDALLMGSNLTEFEPEAEEAPVGKMRSSYAATEGWL